MCGTTPQTRRSQGERSPLGKGAPVLTGKLPDIIMLDTVTSTNDVGLELGRNGAPHGAAVLARRQTQGRGRRGHRWESPEGSVYLSVVLRPHLAPARVPGISLACGLGSLEGLDELGYSNEVQVKWPNDLVWRGRKLGGMVVECGRLDGETFAVCGIGVNVSPRERLEGAPPASGPTPLPPVGLAELGDRAALADPSSPTVEQVARVVRKGIVRRVDAWAGALGRSPESAGTVFPLLGDYQRRLYLLGETVDAVAPDGAPLARGRFAAVDEWGRAVVETCAGEVRLSPEQASLRGC